MRRRRVEPVAFDGDPPQLRKHEQSMIHAAGLAAMCAPFVLLALHVDLRDASSARANLSVAPGVAAKAVPSTSATHEATSDDAPIDVNTNDTDDASLDSRIVLRRILFVPTENESNSDSMDVLYDVAADQRTVEIEDAEEIESSAPDDSSE